MDLLTKIALTVLVIAAIMIVFSKPIMDSDNPKVGVRILVWSIVSVVIAIGFFVGKLLILIWS